MKYKVYDRKCLVCKTKFKPTSNTQTVCTIKCSIEYGKIAAKKKHEQDKKEKIEKIKENVTGVPELKETLQKLVNEICRLIDKGVPCISCEGTTKPQGGHYHSVGSHPAIRFNLLNIHAQDFNCNMAKSGNQHAYDLGLIKTYGKEYWELVKFELPKLYSVLKLTKPELQEAIKKSRQVIKHLKQQDKRYSELIRVDLRHEYNEYIGIYQNNNLKPL